MNKQGTYVSRCVEFIRQVPVKALLAGLAVALVAGFGARAAEPPAGLEGWTRVRLEATKFLVASARSDIERWPAGDEMPALVHVRSLLRYLGNSRDHHAWSVRPGGAAVPARWMELDPGKRARDVRVEKGGQLTLRRFGVPEGQQPPWRGRWSEGKTDVRDLGAIGGGGCAGPFDPWSLLVNLGCLVKGPEVPFGLFSNDGLHRVIAKRRGTDHVTLKLADLAGGPSRDVSLDVVRVELLPGPGEPDPSVFGMQGGVVLTIDVATGAPVQIEGRREGIPGTVRFRLTGFARKDVPRPGVPWPEDAADASAVP